MRGARTFKCGVEKFTGLELSDEDAVAALPRFRSRRRWMRALSGAFWAESRGECTDSFARPYGTVTVTA